MKRRPLGVLAATALVLSLATTPPASATPDAPRDLGLPAKATLATTATNSPSVLREPEVSLGKKVGRETYIVQLSAPAVPTRELAKAPGVAMPTAAGHRREIRNDQSDLVTHATEAIGRAPRVLHRYTEALNGVAVQLTAAEARKVSRLDGVTSVHVDTVAELQSDKGPDSIGAGAIWNGTSVPTGIASKGEGVIVGIIDSGINPSNRSFAATVSEADGGDGYVHTNPYGAGNFKGMCGPDPEQRDPRVTCNDKLIGIYDFTDASRGLFYATNHGSHTASTAAGNQIRVSVGEGVNAKNHTISGVAPHANIISYDVCVVGCSASGTAAAVDQAIKDGVHVLNHSIGGEDATNSWFNPYAVAFRNARAAGIDVAQSAGNWGPGLSTVGTPADLPWVTAVAATDNDRLLSATFTANSDGSPLSALPGAAPRNFSAGTGPTPVPITLAPAGNLGCNDPLPESVAGSIVVCERDTRSLVNKGINADDAGAAGVIVTSVGGSSTTKATVSHALPLLLLDVASGATLKSWLTDPSTLNPTGRISATHASEASEDSDAANAHAITEFSSRGPNRLASTLTPAVSAPGGNILAASGNGNVETWDFMSGTSMAAPHVAGAYALLAATHPDWTPAQAQSALMMSADATVTADGTISSPFVQGAGRVDLARAAQAGLLIDETIAGYMAADPALGSRESTLNSASLVDDACTSTCSFAVDMSATPLGVGTWTVTTASDAGVVIDAPSAFTVTSSGTSQLRVHAEVTASDSNWRFGSVTLTPPTGSSATAARIPVAIRHAGADVPSDITVRAARNDGSVVVSSRFADRSAAAATNVRVQGLARARARTGMVEQAASSDPYTSAGRISKVPLTIPTGATRTVIELESDAPDLDLYVGTGSTPSSGTSSCDSNYETSSESCDFITDGGPVNGWIAVHGFDTGSQNIAEYSLRITYVGSEDPSLSVTTEKSNGEVTSTLSWHDERIQRGEVWYGMMLTETPTATYRTPVTLGRTSTDVVRSQSRTTASFGELVTHTVAFTPTVSNVDQTFEFAEELPAGVTRVEVKEQPAPLTHGGSTTTWQVTVPAGTSETVRYVYTAKASDNNLADDAELQHTLTHRRAGGADQINVASVKLKMPGAPHARALTSTGSGERSVSVFLDEGSTLALLDGTRETTRVDVDGGAYSVETGGVLRFIPVDGRHGTAPSVTYQVTAASGRKAWSTFTATVWPPGPREQDKATSGGTSQRVSLVIESGQRLSLVDGGQPTDRLSTAAGTYAVEGNDLTFVAASGMSGVATPVRFRISDPHGQSADSTWTVIVVDEKPSTGPTTAPSTAPSTGPSTGPSAGPSTGPSIGPQPAPTGKPTSKPAPKVKTSVKVKLTKKTQRQGKSPASARITVKAAKGQAKGKIVVRVNGKATRTIRVTKNRTVTVKFSTRLSRGKKNVSVTFVPSANSLSKQATARTTLRVVR